jgi:hypothetical protein
LREPQIERAMALADGREVCIVVRMPPYLGALENDYSAVALVG